MEDTRIHRAELLLCIDYLMKYTDEKHPASKIAICEHATKFGLKYDKNKSVGNDVRRDRIADALNYLKNLSEKFPDSFPFKIATTESGKFYACNRYFLKDEQIIKLLACIKNDKYISEDETSALVNSVLDIFSNVYNKEKLLSELQKIDEGTKKLSSKSTRTLKIIKQAIKERKLLSTVEVSIKRLNNESIIERTSVKYRVYQLKEFLKKPHVILIPVVGKGIKVKDIDEIKLADIPLEPDFDENIDLDTLFRRANPKVASKYKTIQDLVDASIIPTGRIPDVVTFVVSKVYLDEVLRSFERFSGKLLNSIYCKDYNVFELEGGEKGIKPIGLINEENTDDFTYCIIETRVDLTKFVYFLESNPRVVDMIDIIGPNIVKKNLAKFYHNKFSKFEQDYIE